MRTLIEICLTICEWIQERNIQRAARKAARECDRKTILTFLSQGAVAGAFGAFVMEACGVISYASGYNIIALGGMPIYLAIGALFGSMTAVFVWLPSVLMKRRLPLVVRAIIGMVVVALLVFAAFYFLTDKRELNQLSFAWWAGLSCAMGLPVGFMTGSRVRPLRTIIFGVGRRRARRHFGSWLSIPSGFLLRAGNVFGLLEALMVLALWISNRRVDRDWFPVREHLPLIVVAILYFVISTYFSFKFLRKVFLLPTSIVLNSPLVISIVKLRELGGEDATVVAYLLLGLICLWKVYVFGRLITPEPNRGAVNSVGAIGGSDIITPRFECSVQVYVEN
ncbi:MAG TPA: hypothetical protein VGN90_16205 [Pyrinomonadaceae bacterium]|jgi:hypothetical protein|nr:hypothetical protein [Pyrinomonadaceae bacterium]